VSIVICGGAGFIAVNLLDEFLQDNQVFVLDNLSRGSLVYLNKYADNPNLKFIEHELSDLDQTAKVFGEINDISSISEVWHMAANSDILAGVESPEIDLRDTFLTTHCILLAMKNVGAKKFYFASSSAIYGDMEGKPASESSGPLLPISNYGAMKLASEGLISAATESFLDIGLMYRFPNVVGVPATHGVIFDLIRKLKNNQSELEVLGDGTQQKSYLHVSDLVGAMLYLRDYGKVNSRDVFNIGPVDDGVRVSTIAETVVNRVSPGAKINYGTSDRGWVGDVPKFSYSLDKLLATGWKPKLSSLEAVKLAVDEISVQLAEF